LQLAAVPNTEVERTTSMLRKENTVPVESAGVPSEPLETMEQFWARRDAQLLEDVMLLEVVVIVVGGL
jgi:hypothetical protein